MDFHLVSTRRTVDVACRSEEHRETGPKDSRKILISERSPARCNLACQLIDTIGRVIEPRAPSPARAVRLAGQAVARPTHLFHQTRHPHARLANILSHGQG